MGNGGRMRTIRLVVDLLDYRSRAYFLICVICVIVVPIVASSHGDKNDHASTYEKKTEEGSAKNLNKPKLSTHDESNEASNIKNNDIDSGAQSPKIKNGNSVALNRFLENVLKAKDDFKWIDRAVYELHHAKDLEKSPSVLPRAAGSSRPVNVNRGNKLRGKRGFDRSLETMSMRNEDPRVSNDYVIKTNVDFDDPNVSQNSRNKNEDPSSMKNEAGDRTGDKIPKGWTKTEDICSLSDWLNSDNEPETEEEKRGERWIRAFEANQKNHLDFDECSVDKYKPKNQQNEPLSLESLKETVLQLKKSLNGPAKKLHDSDKNVATRRVKGESKERRTRGKNKHRATEHDGSSTHSDQLESSGQAMFDSKNRDQDFDDRNARSRVWRTKRTEINNDDGNQKLFGEPYLEEEALKEQHYRKRRSKGTPSNKKRYNNEVPDKNNIEEQNSMKIFVEADCNNRDDSVKSDSSSNDFQGNHQPSDTNDVSKNSKIPDGNENFEQSYPPQRDLTVMENKLTKNEETGENLEGNSLQTFGSLTNEVQPVPIETSGSRSTDGEQDVSVAGMQKTEKNQENVDMGNGEQVIKVFEPQGGLYQNSERTKEVQRIESNEEAGKLSQKSIGNKRSSEESGNIDILVKSENKNLIEFSNSGGQSSSDEQPFVLNRFDMRKKLIVENDRQPGKTIATVYNMKLEKTQVDTPGKDNRKREDIVQAGDGTRLVDGSSIFGFGKSKPEEDLFKDTFQFVKEAKPKKDDPNDDPRNVEVAKEFIPSVNAEQSRNLYESIGSNQISMDSDQTSVEKDKEEGVKNKPENKEDQSGEDKKEKIVENITPSSEIASSSTATSVSALKSEARQYDGTKKKKHHEIVIVDDNTVGRKLNHAYSQRRILQYMEYANDDVEDAEVNYNDKEEQDKQQAGEVEDNTPLQRKQRFTAREKDKAKVNMLIKNKLKKKQKTKRENVRKRRNPINFIAYYDYDDDDDDTEQDVHGGVQEQVNSNSQQDVIESNVGLEAAHGAHIPVKVDQQEEEMRKQQRRKEKLKNKGRVTFYVPPGDKLESSNYTETAKNPNESFEFFKIESPELDGSLGKPGRSNQGENNVNGMNRGRSNQPFHGQNENLPNNDRDEVIVEPVKYIITVDDRVIPESVDNIIDDFQFIEHKDDKMTKDVEPLYEELKKLYDWNDEEVKSKPRIKGDQRMYHEPSDKVDTTNTFVESFENQLKSPETQNSYRASDSSPNLLPLLLVHDGSGNTEIEETSYPVASAEQLESPPAPCNRSQSNYFALKSTDDMFKGGSEQVNSTQEKLRGPSSAIRTSGGAESRAKNVQKVNEGRNDVIAKKDAPSGSLTGRGKYIDTDSRSPYENHKYQEPAASLPRECVQNVDQEKRTVISSKDLHESFVEPLDWLDDSDNDIRVRISRGLKTIEKMIYSNVTRNEGQDHESSETMLGKDVISVSTEISRTKASSLVTTATPETSELGFIVNSAKDRRSSSGRDNARVKREIGSRYETFYDDMNEHQRNSERMNYNRFLKNTDATANRLQLLNSYGNVNDRHHGVSHNSAEYDYPGNDEDYDYRKVARSAKAKKDDKHKKKKKHRGGRKKKKKKHRKDTSKYTSSKNRKRRHRKKHSNDPKTSGHDHKKHNKHVSNTVNHHTNVKKSKTDQVQGKLHDDHRQQGKKRHRKEMRHDNTPNAESDAHRNAVSLLLAADNVEDESQMDSALRGELAGKIVEQIFSQVQNNEDLKVSLGPGLYQKHKTDEAVATNKKYRQAVSDDESKHTEELLKKVMQLLNLMVFDEVQRKTCMSLPPDLVEFLTWVLDVEPGGMSQEQLPSMRLVQPAETPEHFPRDKFLFQASPGKEVDVGEIHKKVRLIEGLIKEYNGLSETEKSKVQSVQDYLGKQLDSMLEYIEANEEETKGKSSVSDPAAERNSGRILQAGIRNATNGNELMRPTRFSAAVSVTDMLKVGNTGIFGNRNRFHDRLRVPRSAAKRAKHHKRRKVKGKRKRRKHRKRHKGASTIDRTRHKDTGHKAAASRQKRDYLDKDFWASFDTGYEQPVIYSSMDMINARTSNGELERKANSEVKSPEEPRYTEEVLVKGLERNEGNLPRTSDQTSETPEAKSSSISTSQDPVTMKEEAITGKNLVEDEILLLNKRQSWKKENEEQLEEVAFGEDMRKGSLEKELFEKLTEMDKERSAENKRKDIASSIGSSTSEGNDSRGRHGRDYSLKDSADDTYLSDEDKLRMLEQKINVYSDNDRDTRREQPVKDKKFT